MEDLLKHPALVIVTLVIAVASGAYNFKLSTDPAARADSFTGEQGSLLRDRIDYIEGMQRVIREEQVKVMLRLDTVILQLNKNTDDLSSRKNIRWNTPDQREWIKNTEQINEGWRGANP